jgi:hypothetical protein
MLINAYSTCRQVSPLSFRHQLGGRRDRTDPVLRQHLREFIGYVAGRGEDRMTAAKYHVMRHLERVRHHLSLTVDETELGAFSDWAWNTNALCFLPDGSVRDPSLRMLIDSNGAGPDPEAEIPHPREAVERMARTGQHLRALGIRCLPTLPPVGAEGEIELRTAASVAERALALFIVAVRAESLANGPEITVAELRDRMPPAFTALSPKEKDFLTKSSPERQQVIDSVWRYESLAVLLWALGELDDLPLPTAICDVPAVARIMVAKTASFIADAKLRPAEAILDALDLHYRLHWAIRQSRQDGKPVGAPLDASVVQERHVAFNWLIHFGDAEWDEVDTPT